MMRISVLPAAAGLALAALAGCAPSPAPPGVGPAAPPVTAAFDGHYVGTVRFTAIANGGLTPECAVEPHLSVQVRQGQFVYVQTHPRMVGQTPGATPQATTATFTAIIAPDGTIQGDSGNLGGKLWGRVEGARMTGRISGLLCDYAFSAERV